MFKSAEINYEWVIRWFIKSENKRNTLDVEAKEKFILIFVFMRNIFKRLLMHLHGSWRNSMKLLYFDL